MYAGYSHQSTPKLALMSVHEHKINATKRLMAIGADFKKSDYSIDSMVIHRNIIDLRKEESTQTVDFTILYFLRLGGPFLKKYYKHSLKT